MNCCRREAKSARDEKKLRELNDEIQELREELKCGETKIQEMAAQLEEGSSLEVGRRTNLECCVTTYTLIPLSL